MSGDSAEHILSFNEFCDLYKEVLASNGVSLHLLRNLHRKLEEEIYDAGEYFLLTPDESTGRFKVLACKDEGIELSDENAVFLIDHAWTYRAEDARKKLCETPGLVQRLSQMMGYSVHGEVFGPDDDIVEQILKDMWKYNQTYCMGAGSAEQKLPLWYIMDEFGTSINHSDSPTAIVFPFFYQPKGISFSIMVLLTDLNYADEVTRDYANYEKDPLLRKCKLLPWIDADFSEVSSEVSLFSNKSYEDRYSFAGETLPLSSNNTKKTKKRLTVYMGPYSEFLTDATSFEVVEDMEEADILFLSESLKDFRKFSEERPDVYLNQFPGEMIMFCKDFFMDIAKRSTKNGRTPPWHTVTFDLHSQLPQFVSFFKKRLQYDKKSNVWICKPWNLARSLDITVTDDLNQIIRLRETDIPKVASSYIVDPVLIFSPEAEAPVKFDLRYIVLVTSMEPLKAHVCDVFYAKTSSKPFSLDHFDDLGRHLAQTATPANRLAGSQFVEQFEEQYPDYDWNEINKAIHKNIHQFLKCASSRSPPYGVGQYSNSRAIYGFDVMLQWDVDDSGDRYFQPILLECNFTPNLVTFCRFYPSFFNDAFRFLFMDDGCCRVTDISDLPDDL